MKAIVRLDLTMAEDEKDVVSRAAALMGITMASFVRAAAQEKAQGLLDREARLTFSERDFRAFTKALNVKFAPIAVLSRHVTQSQSCLKSKSLTLYLPPG